MHYNIAKTITSIIGNTLSGQAKAPETLDWLQKLFGKVKHGRSFRIDGNNQVDSLIAGIPAITR